MPPPTIIVVHPKERRSKCSVEPLRGDERFLFWTFPRQEASLLPGRVRLGLGGELLSPEDRERGLVVLDGTWRLVERMAPDYATLPVRSLLPWRTAYPRHSKLTVDPAAGLATVEAIYAARLQMGLAVDALLDEYRWRDEFLSMNEELIATLAT
ncbi:MAG: DUF367 domain-containing protein [Planctomycetaceae bacterium]